MLCGLNIVAYYF